MCPTLPPMDTRTRIVLLMHTKEYKYVKNATGRITCLNLANSEIIPGVGFEDNARYRALIEDPANYPVFLYPGQNAMDVKDESLTSALGGRRLVVFIADATWRCSHATVRLTPSLQAMPRLKIQPLAPSRYRIKKQPAPHCLSTLEAVHELLLALEASGLDSYPDKERLLLAFEKMQEFQIKMISTGAKRQHVVRGIREPL